MAYIGNNPSFIRQGRRAVYTFTATLGQRDFTGVDDNGLTLDLLEANENDVYLNGVRLIEATDYNTSGDTLTLVSGAAAGDQLVIVTQDEIQNVASYTKAEADSRYINYDGDIVNGDLQIVGDISLGDNDKVQFGAGSDLQIYHDGSNSYISEVGAGNLRVQGTNNVYLQVSSDGGTTWENAVLCDADGAVTLRYNNFNKLATTTTGIDVTGTVTADGLTVDGLIGVNTTATPSELSVGAVIAKTTNASALQLANNVGGSEGGTLLYSNSANEFGLYTYTGAIGSESYKPKLYVGATGDISFYEDTGTTAKFFWDASAERLGIGTSSPSSKLDVNNGNSTSVITITSSADSGINFNESSTTRYQFRYRPAQNIFSLYSSLLGSDIISISDASGNIGVKNTSPSVSLDMSSTTDGLALPSGTDAQRPSNPPTGTSRYNSTLGRIEYFNGNDWSQLSVDKQVSVTDGLVALFYLNNNFIDGTAISSAVGDGNTYTGTFNTSPTLILDSPSGGLYPQSWRTNANDTCAGDQYIPFESGGTNNHFSVVCWMKFNDSADSSFPMDFSAGADTSSVFRWENQGSQPNPNIEFGINPGGTWAEVGEYQDSLTVGDWLCVATTYDQSQIKIYVNGVLENSVSTSINPITNSSQRFCWGGRFFNSRRDRADFTFYSIRYYNRAITASEVQTIYNNVE